MPKIVVHKQTFASNSPHTEEIKSVVQNELATKARLYAFSIPARAFENGPYNLEFTDDIDATKCIFEFRISAWNYKVFINGKTQKIVSISFFDLYNKTFINESPFIVDVTAYQVFN